MQGVQVRLEVIADGAAHGFMWLLHQCADADEHAAHVVVCFFGGEFFSWDLV